jgi:hypothetical protein
VIVAWSPVFTCPTWVLSTVQFTMYAPVDITRTWVDDEFADDDALDAFDEDDAPVGVCADEAPVPDAEPAPEEALDPLADAEDALDPVTC